MYSQITGLSCAGQGYRRCAIRMVLVWPGPTAPCSRIPPTLTTPTRMQSGLCEHADMWSLIVWRRLEKMWHCRWCMFPPIFSTAEKNRYCPTSILPLLGKSICTSIRSHRICQVTFTIPTNPTSDTNISKSKYFRDFNLELLVTWTF